MNTNTTLTAEGCLTDQWNYSVDKLMKTAARVRDSFPHVSIDGKYNDEGPKWWTAGFWSGILWQLYEVNGDEEVKAMAQSCEKKLDDVLYGFDTVHHDVGFMWILSSVADYKVTGNMESRRRGLIAASYLASRFNLKGGFIRAWNDRNFEDSQGWAIIDCMMNLSLLFWASEELNDPRFRHMAVAHADTVIREFVRQDGSVHHIVCFDPETGDRINALAGQGFSEDSAWARGMAWAIYGFAICYKYTGYERYLETSLKAAEYFMSNLPEDGVSLWDFKASEDCRDAWDSSAGACAASGLLELTDLLDDERGIQCRKNAIRLLDALTKECLMDDGDEALLSKGTVYYSKDKYVNTPIIYGDFFYLEALGKLNGYKRLYW